MAMKSKSKVSILNLNPIAVFCALGFKKNTSAQGVIETIDDLGSLYPQLQHLPAYIGRV